MCFERGSERGGYLHILLDVEMKRGGLPAVGGGGRTF